ncbi:trimeric intracellular cation channel family protein [Candidatus Methylopumilus turicensis]|nr:trimeric intracellular cation channel family protein [Candidatus Methylopumilus turicensis]
MRKRMDLVGLCIVSGVSAFGGGTLRDILLDRRPFFWVSHSAWLWVLILTCILAMFFMRERHLTFTEKAIQIPDALGLGLFTALGTQIALDLNMPAIVAALMGVMTAVFGGVLRDICCNEIPKAFNDHQPYALLAFLDAWIVISLSAMGLQEWFVLSLAASITTILRGLAIQFKWQLPHHSHIKKN